MKSLKLILAIVLLSLSAFTIRAQEQWVIEFNDGSQSAFDIQNIRQMFVTYGSTETGSDDQEHDNIPNSTTVTGGVSGITAVSATMQGYANNVTLSETAYAGICYSSVHNTPTTDDHVLTSYSVDKDNAYTVVAKRLAPSTTYYYRAFIYRGGIVQYAASTYSFTTPSTAGVVTTGAASEITSIYANITSSHNLPSSAYSYLQCGVCYSTESPVPTTDDINITATAQADGSFTVGLTGLTAGTLYYYRSYIIVDGLTIYGETRSFKTDEVSTAETIAVTGMIDDMIKSPSATITCTANIGGLDFSTIELGVCWSTTHAEPTLDDNTVFTQQMDAESNYTVTLSRIKVGATHYYRAYIKTDKDIYYGAVKTFSTAEEFDVEYVEIGGIKWATMNLGASSIAGSPATCFGDYFAWGETDPRYTGIMTYYKSNYAYATFQGWRSEHSEGYSSKDVPSYTDSFLDAEHDAATDTWGDKWRTPTKEDFEALALACGGSINNYDIDKNVLNTSNPTGGIYWLEIDQQYLPEYTGVCGTLFVDQTDTNNRIFFPNAGGIGYFNDQSDHYDKYWPKYFSWVDCIYWTSSKRDEDFAYSQGVDGACLYRYSRKCFLGYPIRPISD